MITVQFQSAKTHVKTPQPHTYLKKEQLPKLYDPRNVNGKDFTTVNRNQHIPVCKYSDSLLNPLVLGSFLQSVDNITSFGGGGANVHTCDVLAECIMYYHQTCYYRNFNWSVYTVQIAGVYYVLSSNLLLSKF